MSAALDPLELRKFSTAVNANAAGAVASGAQFVQGTVANVNEDGTAQVVLPGSTNPVPAKVLTQAQGTLSAGQSVEIRRQGGYAVIHGTVDALPPTAIPTEPVVPPGLVVNELNGAAPTADLLAKVNNASPSYVTGGVTVTFASPFPNACTEVIVQPNGEWFPITSALSPTGFKIKFYVPVMPASTTAGTAIAFAEANAGVTVPFTYFAIGS